MLSATLIEARKITDKRHGYRGRVSLIDLGNGSEKARIKPRLISGGWPFPMGSGAPKGPLQVPGLFGESWGAKPGENNVCFGTVNGLKSDTAPSPKSANKRKRACTPPDNFLSEELAFTRKGQGEHDFSCWRTLRPPLDAVLAHVADE